MPDNAQVIFAPFKGHGDRRLSVDPGRKNFSLVFSCEGEGRFSLAQDLGDLEPCRRGLSLHLTVATGGGPHVLRVRTMPDTTWRMVVIEETGSDRTSSKFTSSLQISSRGGLSPVSAERLSLATTRAPCGE